MCIMVTSGRRWLSTYMQEIVVAVGYPLKCEAVFAVLWCDFSQDVTIIEKHCMSVLK